MVQIMRIWRIKLEEENRESVKEGFLLQAKVK